MPFTGHILVGRGGAWVFAPDRPADGICYVEYSSRSADELLNVRHFSNPVRPGNPAYVAGDSIATWLLLDQNNGTLSVNEQTSEDISSGSVNITLGGISVPQDILRKGHQVIIQTSDWVNGPWDFFARTWISSVTMRQENTVENSIWDIRCKGIQQFAMMQNVEPIVVGEIDMALGSQVNSSPTLGNPLFEVGTGEVYGWNPGVSPNNTVDGNKSTLWISEQARGTKEEFTVGRRGFTELYVNNIYGSRIESRYAAMSNVDMQDKSLWYYNAENGQWGEVPDVPNEIQDGGDHDFVIVGSEEAFSREHPGYSGTIIVPRMDTGDNEPVMNLLSPVGGFLGWKWQTTWQEVVVWGDISGLPGALEEGWWSGPPLPVPANGEIWRRAAEIDNPGNPWDDQASYWVNNRKSPLGLIGDDGDDVWVMWTLGGMDLELASDVPAGETALPIRSMDGYRTTDGLPPNGTVLVGREPVPYSSKTADTLICSPTTQDHVEGDMLLLNYKGYYTDAYPISRLEFHRYGGDPHAAHVWAAYSCLEGPTPGQSEHEVHYRRYGEIRDNYTPGGPDWTWTLPADTRVRTVLLGFRDMNHNYTRAWLNDFNAYLNRPYFTAERWVAATVPDLLVNTILKEGLGYNALLSGGVPGDWPIDPGYAKGVVDDGNCWELSTDIAALMSSLLIADRRGRLLWIWVPWGGTGAWPAPKHTWDESDLMSYEVRVAAGKRISQFELNWRTPDDEEVNTAVFPSTPDNMGEVFSSSEFILMNESDALNQARKRYYMSLNPNLIIGTIPELMSNLRLGDVAEVNSSYDTHGILRRGIITGITYDIANQASTTTVQLREIYRETI